MAPKRWGMMLSGAAMIMLAALMLVLLFIMLVDFAPTVLTKAEDGLPPLAKASAAAWIIFGIFGWLSGAVLTGYSGWMLICNHDL